MAEARARQHKPLVPPSVQNLRSFRGVNRRYLRGVQLRELRGARAASALITSIMRPWPRGLRAVRASNLTGLVGPAEPVAIYPRRLRIRKLGEIVGLRVSLLTDLHATNP